MINSKTISFYKWLSEELIVEIPMLQRDYAQGRNDARIRDLREKFVEDLFAAFDSDKPLHLDFIYGPKHDEVFHPLDGQQRLTTLFLLHWYIAKKAGKLDEAVKVLKSFRYKVRVTTQEFIDAILTHNDKEFSAEDLKDARWFYSAWDFDPSVQGMLQMIDSIDKCFNGGSVGADKVKADKLWRRLITPAKSPIHFTVLDMNGFGLGDELYMRMNARGLALTDFENFKAWLQRVCEESQVVGLMPGWKDELDGPWAKLVWKLSDKNDIEHRNDFDACFMRIFNNFAACSIASKFDKKEKKVTEDLIKNITSDSSILTSSYPAVAFSQESLSLIFNLLNALCHEENEYCEGLSVGFDEKEIYSFKKLLSSQKVGERRKLVIIAYAIAKFVSFKGASESESFKDWVRVVRNLVENTEINREELFVSAIQSLDILIDGMKKNGGDILTLLSGKPIALYTFKEQLKEEQLKAYLVKGCGGISDWKPLIVAAENHPLFRGQISFLLLSVKTHFENRTIPSIDCFGECKELKTTAMKLWGIEGSIYEGEKSYLLIRNLFLIMPNISNANYSENAENWRRLLKSHAVHIVKMIKNVDSNNINDSLEKNIKCFSATVGGLDWARLLISNEKLISNRPIVERAENYAVLSDKSGQWNQNRYSVFPKRTEFFTKVKERFDHYLNVENDNETAYWRSFSLVTSKKKIKVCLEKDARSGALTLGVLRDHLDDDTQKDGSLFSEYTRSKGVWFCFKQYDFSRYLEGSDSLANKFFDEVMLEFKLLFEEVVVKLEEANSRF